MVEEVGTVVELQGEMARVAVPKKSACEGCTMGTCKQGDDSMLIEALNSAGAQVGDRVQIVMRSLAFAKGSFIVYGIPAIALVIGAVTGKDVVSKYFPSADADVLSAFFGFGFLGLSFLIIRALIGFFSRGEKGKPVINQILP